MILVALTGWSQEEDRKKSRDAGFDGHMAKPLEHRDLTALLAQWMAGRVFGAVVLVARSVPREYAIRTQNKAVFGPLFRWSGSACQS